jgi:hypothetical protein
MSLWSVINIHCEKEPANLLQYYKGIVPEGRGILQETFQDNPFPGRDLKLEPTEHEPGPLSSVQLILKITNSFIYDDILSFKSVL